ncbi:MAG: hypothetical protein WBD55_12050 [Dehalococcoidia bacterium]
MIGRIDPLGRAAFGVLCIGGMLLEAIPVLVVVGVVGGIGIAVDGNFDRALWVWLGSWGASVVATLLFLLITYVSWPLASDWITEWQGYVTALFIAAGGLALMSLTVFVTAWPLALELIVPFVITFLVGFSTPGRFLGLSSSLPTLREAGARAERAKAARRR